MYGCVIVQCTFFIISLNRNKNIGNTWIQYVFIYLFIMRILVATDWRAAQIDGHLIILLYGTFIMNEVWPPYL